jgi:peroxiredoxin
MFRQGLLGNRKLISFLFVFTYIVPMLLISPGAAVGISVQQGNIAPDFTAETIDGQPVSLSDYRGQVVFIAFWSSWCSRCKEEMDYLKELKVQYPEVAFLAINAEGEEPDAEAIERMRNAIEDWGIPFTVLIDKGLKIWDLYKVNALPTSFIIDGDGRTIFAEPNFYFASPENIQNAMKQLTDPDVMLSEQQLPSASAQD